VGKYTWWIIGAVVLFILWRYWVAKSEGTGGSTVGMSSQTPSA